MSGEYQTDETKEWTPFEKLSEIPIDQGNITLRGHLQDKILEGNKVMLYLDHLTLTFSLNGKEIYHSRENVEICWDFITSQGITPQDEVVMQVQEQKSRGYVEAFQKFFDKFYYGDRFTLHRKQISDHIVKIFICIIIWTLGVASIVTGAALRYLKITATWNAVFF